MQEKHNIESLVSSVHLLNCKILKLYKEKSNSGCCGRTAEYKDNIIKDKVLEFLHKDKVASSDLQDEIPSIKVFGLRDFRQFINGK